MELRNLITLIRVAEQGSFTRAAEQLGYSQSTISFQIKQLEEELGCLLFERINHTVKLTERGRELLDYAHRVHSMSEELREQMAGEEVCRGQVHVVTPDSICERMISSHYAAFRRLYPEISLRFTAADTGVMTDMLDHNEADVIITLDSRIYRRDYVIYAEEPLPMHFVTGAASRFRDRRGLQVQQLLSEPFVLTESGQGYRRVLDRALAERSLAITPVLEIGRTDLITEILAEGEMISFLPDFVAEPHVRAGRLCYLDVAEPRISIWKQLIYHKNKWKSAALRCFLDYVREHEFRRGET